MFSLPMTHQSQGSGEHNKRKTTENKEQEFINNQYSLFDLLSYIFGILNTITDLSQSRKHIGFKLVKIRVLWRSSSGINVET